MRIMPQATVPQPFSSAEHYHVLGATLSITADSEATDCKYLVLDMLVPPMFEHGLHQVKYFTSLKARRDSM
jgi:hypothetical protein